MKKTFVLKENNVAVKVLSLLLVAFFMAVLGSCTSTPTQILSTDDDLIEGSGYIYGNFGVIMPEGGTPSPRSRMSIVIQNLDTLEKYGLLLQPHFRERLQIVAVPSGNYRVESVEFMTPGYSRNNVETKDFTIASYERNFVVEQNTAVYIGDFLGTLVITSGYDRVYYSFGVKVPTNNYDETTATIKEMYPFFTESPITFVSNMQDPQISDAEKPSASEN